MVIRNSKNITDEEFAIYYQFNKFLESTIIYDNRLQELHLYLLNYLKKAPVTGLINENITSLTEEQSFKSR